MIISIILCIGPFFKLLLIDGLKVLSDSNSSLDSFLLERVQAFSIA